MEDDPTPAFGNTSLAEQAKQALKDEIFSGALEPGDRIDIAEYAKRWAISPTPVRDAVKALEISGLVDISPRRGVFVAKMDIAALREIFELRIGLESTATRLAAGNIPKKVAEDALQKYRAAGKVPKAKREKALEEVDFLIHQLVKDYCGNRRMQRMMDSVWDLFEWSRCTIIQKVPVPYLATLPEHVEICERLRDGDGVGAERAMREHLERAFARIQAEFANDDSKK